jgi:hypothetical protein
LVLEVMERMDLTAKEGIVHEEESNDGAANKAGVQRDSNERLCMVRCRSCAMSADERTNGYEEEECA